MCHPGSQYWRYFLLPHTSLGLFLPLQPFCVSASDPGSFSFLSTAESPFHYFITWSWTLKNTGVSASGAPRTAYLFTELDSSTFRLLFKHRQLKCICHQIKTTLRGLWMARFWEVGGVSGPKGQKNHSGFNCLILPTWNWTDSSLKTEEKEETVPFPWEQKEILCQICCSVQTWRNK